MKRKVYWTTVRPERWQEYIDAHKKVPEHLMDRYAAAGMRHCSVYILGLTLVMVVDAEDHVRLADAMKTDTIDVAWQAHVGPMKAEGDWQEMESMFHADL